MIKELKIELPIPYAVYDVNYSVSTLTELYETKALILLAIVSNKKVKPTDTLQEVIHGFYHLNDNYDSLFQEALNNLISNKTINNDQDELPSLQSFVGNFNIDEKIKKLLDNDEGFFGNSEQKHTHQLDLKKGIFSDLTLQQYHPNDKNLIPFSKLVCNAFIDKNKENNNKYNQAIVEHINNYLIKGNENLFNHELKYQEEINNGLNLVYFKTPCIFKVDINDNQINIFPHGQLEEKIYNDYYLSDVFYQNLLQLICDQLSCSLPDIPLTEKINQSFDFIEDEKIINQNECKSLGNNTYFIIDNQLWQLFIYNQEVNDEINKACWKKLYKHTLNDAEIKSLIDNYLNDDNAFINWIFEKLNNQIINDYILQSICQNQQTVNIYQNLIKNNFDKCLKLLINNKIDLELINDLFPTKIDDYLNTQIANYHDTFLQMLTAKLIANPKLQIKIISKFNFDYTKNQTYLVDCKLEKEIINQIDSSQQLLRAANQLNKDKLSELYSQLKNQMDSLKKLNKELNLTCLTNTWQDLSNKLQEVKNQLAEKHFATLTTRSQDNRQILEVTLPELLGFEYDKSKGYGQVRDNEIVKDVLNRQEQKEFKDLQTFNNDFVHGNPDINEYSDTSIFEKAFKKLQEYNQFLLSLKNKIKKFKEENKKKEGK